MPLALNNSFIIMYADDATLYSSNVNVFNLCNDLSDDLACIDCWLKCNYLTLNYKKTNFTIFSHKYIPEDIKISINNTQIKRSLTLNFLGVILDHRLTFKNQISKIINTLSKTQGIIFKLNYLPTKVLRSLYMTLFQPYLIYCIEAWGCCSPSILQPLIILQKKVIRVISGASFYDHTNELFKNLNILKIYDLFTLFMGLYCFKIFNGLKRQDIMIKIACMQTNHKHNLRNNNLTLPAVNINKFKQSVLYQVIYTWNNLSNGIKNVLSLSKFKRNLKKELISKY